ncbi:hypothetical protein Dimus_022390 [Dionaea muscipula]
MRCHCPHTRRGSPTARRLRHRELLPAVFSMPSCCPQLLLSAARSYYCPQLPLVVVSQHGVATLVARQDEFVARQPPSETTTTAIDITRRQLPPAPLRVLFISPLLLQIFNPHRKPYVVRCRPQPHPPVAEPIWYVTAEEEHRHYRRGGTNLAAADRYNAENHKIP